MEEFCECPICLEAPEGIIYQCFEGHFLCSVCITKLTNNKCPQCRTSYGAKRIRCRVLEVFLDGQMFECKFKEQGCNIWCARGNLSTHANSCEFNQDLIPLCQLLGSESCKFRIDACLGGGFESKRSDIINHIIEIHEEHFSCGSHLKIPGNLFKTIITKSLTSGKPSQKIFLRRFSSKRKSPLFLVIVRIISENAFILLNCVQIWGADSSKKYEVDYSFVKVATSPQTQNSTDVEKCEIDKFEKPFKTSWTLNAYTPREIAYTLESCPIGINKYELMDHKFGDNNEGCLNIAISLKK